jgi:hypothetical protein
MKDDDEDLTSLIVNGDEDDVLDELWHQQAKVESLPYEPTVEELREADPYERYWQMRVATRRQSRETVGTGVHHDADQRRAGCGEAHPLGGVCDAFPEIHCPSCGQPLCFVCAVDHCSVTAPLCGTSGVRRAVEQCAGIPIVSPLYDE